MFNVHKVGKMAKMLRDRKLRFRKCCLIFRACGQGDFSTSDYVFDDGKVRFSREGGVRPFIIKSHSNTGIGRSNNLRLTSIIIVDNGSECSSLLSNAFFSVQ